MQAAVLASLAASAVAAPLVSRRQAPAGVDDGVILNYALTLEHLEATFYREALAKFSDEDFKKAGLGADFVDNLKEIAKDEATHVDFLTTALTAAKVTPAQECTYAFGYTDVQSFLATANLLEGVGVSAYLGAAQFIANKDYLTAAGSILTVESRHSAYIRDNQTPKPLSPFPAPFDIPLSFNEVFSLAAPLITGCPSGGAGTLDLPFKAYPSISVGPAGAAKPGDKLTFTVKEKVDASACYFITFPGGAIPADIATADGITYQVTVPEAAQPGQAYVVFTKDGKAPTDDNTVAGPAVFEVLDNAGAFQKANPDYSYGKDCDNEYEHKPEGYPAQKPEGYPTKDNEHKPEGYPTNDNEHKPEGYPTKDNEHKPEGYPTKDNEHKPEGHPTKDNEHKPEGHPTKDNEHKPEGYPAKDNEHKPEGHPTKDNEHKPEDHPAKDTPKSPEYPTKDTPKSPAKPEHKDEYPAKPEHKDEYPAAPKPEYKPKDKAGHEYPLDKEGHVCVYKADGKTAYPLDKSGLPYGKDETSGKYYNVDAYGKKEPCVEGYSPY